MAKTTLDIRLPARVKTIVAKYGKPIDFHIDAPDYDPTTGINTVTRTTHSDVLVTPPAGYEDRFIDGKSVKRGDTWVLLPADGLAWAPDAENTVVEFDSNTWKVVSVKSIYTGTIVGAYIIQLRK